MTYLKDRTEYLTPDEIKVWESVQYLSGKGRTTNNSQIASDTGLSRTKVGDITTGLRRRGYLRDVSKGAAYHWRVTGKPAESEHGEDSCGDECPEYPGLACRLVAGHEKDSDHYALGISWPAELPSQTAAPDEPSVTPEQAASYVAGYGGQVIGGRELVCIEFPDMHSLTSWASAAGQESRVTFATQPASLTDRVRIWHDQSAREGR